MAKQRTGTIYKGPKGELWVKFTIDVLDQQGNVVGTRRESHNLHTDNKRLAVLKRAELRNQLELNGVLPKSEAKEVVSSTPKFRDAAELVMRDMTIADLDNRRSRVERWAYPVIGDRPIDDIWPADITDCLQAMADDGKAKASVTHLKWDLSAIWKELEYRRLVPEHRGTIAKKAKMPECREDNRERAVLTDEELQQYLSWRHPGAAYASHVLERQTMCCLARLFGGARTGEILRLRWQDLDVGQWTEGWIDRRKTRRHQALVIPEMLRPILTLWWERAGKPTDGFLFPQRRGLGKGEEGRDKKSFARALRQDLARVFGLETWDPERRKFVPTERPMTKRETVLLKGDDWHKPVDFHSWRRAFNQAMARANVNAQTAKDLGGWTSEAFEKYLRTSHQAKELPREAQPKEPLRLHDPAAPVLSVRPRLRIVHG